MPRQCIVKVIMFKFSVTAINLKCRVTGEEPVFKLLHVGFTQLITTISTSVPHTCIWHQSDTVLVPVIVKMLQYKCT